MKRWKPIAAAWQTLYFSWEGTAQSWVGEIPPPPEWLECIFDSWFYCWEKGRESGRKWGFSKALMTLQSPSSLPAWTERLQAHEPGFTAGYSRPSTEVLPGKSSGLSSPQSTQLTFLTQASPFWKRKVIRILTHMYRVLGIKAIFTVGFEHFTMKSEYIFKKIDEYRIVSCWIFDKNKRKLKKQHHLLNLTSLT